MSMMCVTPAAATLAMFASVQIPPPTAIRGVTQVRSIGRVRRGPHRGSLRREILILPYRWIYAVERHRRIPCLFRPAVPAGLRRAQEPQQQSGQRFVLHFLRSAVCRLGGERGCALAQRLRRLDQALHNLGRGFLYHRRPLALRVTAATAAALQVGAALRQWLLLAHWNQTNPSYRHTEYSSYISVEHGLVKNLFSCRY